MAEKREGAALRKFKEDLAAGTPGPAYIFYGEETYLRSHYLSELRRKLIPAGFEEFNDHALDGKTLTAEALSEVVEAMPMMAERTLTSGRSSSPSSRTCRTTAAWSSSTIPWPTSQTRP